MTDEPRIDHEEDPTQIKKALDNPAATILPYAVLEVIYEPFFELIDKRGEVLSIIKDCFPRDVNIEGAEFNLGLQDVSIVHTASRTKTSVGVKRSVFNRQNMIPGTLDYFFDRLNEQAETIFKILPTNHPLVRAGIRVHQFNYIDSERKFNETRFNFNRTFLHHESFLGKIKGPNTSTILTASNFAYTAKETQKMPDRIQEYRLRVGCGVVELDAAKDLISIRDLPLRDLDYCIFSDCDFQIRDLKSVKDIHRLSVIAQERSQLIHDRMLKAVDYAR